jgi:hypothetical protein
MLFLSPLGLAQDPLKTLPNNYRTIFENDSVAVIRAHYVPNEKVSIPDHPAVTTVFVYLNNSGEVRPPTVLGAFRIDPAVAGTNRVENLSDPPSDFLLVELKQVSLQLPEPFTGPAPQSLNVDQDSLAFSAPTLQIERIVCTAPCPVNTSTSPSLLIALTPFQASAGDAQAPAALDTGAVQWLPPLQAPTITLNAEAPAHLLRILLPPNTH